MFERSSVSPIAFFFVRFTRTKSSSEFEATRNPNAEPTFPLPIIDISWTSLDYFTIRTGQLTF